MRPTQEKPVAHGGDLDAARRFFPDAPAPWIDLSTGINPAPYPVPELPAEAWARLPLASEEEALRSAAARRYGAPDPDMVVAAPGAQALIQMLPRLLPPSRVAVLSPAYGEHAASWAREGHAVVEVHDPEEAAADVLVVVNPNNPTGFTIAPVGLLRLAETVAARSGLLVVDEAFMDVMEPALSLVPHIPPRTIVLRSFGKAYGLAGLRLGFAVADRETAARLRERLGPWAVSGPALAIGRQALNDEAWLRDARQRLARDAARLESMLSAAGLASVGATALFRLVSHPECERFAAVLGRQGIHVRRFAEHPTWLRIGLPGSEPAWQRLGEALRSAASRL
jgi:cobalamin biosynthetic protein CobC